MLRLEQLTLQRGGRELVCGMNASLDAGQICIVLGSNGVGKSTLLLAMAGLHAPAAGCIRIGNRNIAGMSPKSRASRLAWSGEQPSTEFGLTVADRLELAIEAGDQMALHDVAKCLELDALLNRDLGRLSAGERQRCEIAALLLRDAPIWLLDEPCAHLDLRHQVDVLALLRRQAADGRLIVMVLHDLVQAAAVADRVLLLDGKGGWQFGEAERLLNSERLGALFKTRLIEFVKADRRPLLIPDMFA